MGRGASPDPSEARVASLPKANPMVDFSEDFVRIALALHVDRDPESIRPDMWLERDLGLDPLDLVLIVLRLEEVAAVELPVVEFDTIRTVADLDELVRRWLGPRNERETALPPLQSGFHPVASAAAVRARAARER